MVEDHVALDGEVVVAEEIGHEAPHPEFFGRRAFLTSLCHFYIWECHLHQGVPYFIGHQQMPFAVGCVFESQYETPFLEHILSFPCFLDDVGAGISNEKFLKQKQLCLTEARHYLYRVFKHLLCQTRGHLGLGNVGTDIEVKTAGYLEHGFPGLAIKHVGKGYVGLEVCVGDGDHDSIFQELLDFIIGIAGQVGNFGYGFTV